MFVLLNGSFGIGKTTSARALTAELASASIYDPEPLGIILQHATAWLSLRRPKDDFQDLAVWRYLTARGARWWHRRSEIVIVPMAFSNLDYFEELANALRPTAPVLKICLVAPLDVIRERLETRAQAQGTTLNGWALRRAEECCQAHQSQAFGQPIDATLATADIVHAVTALVLHRGQPE